MLAPTDYEISEAENGEEALTAIAKQRPDFILMDIQFPIMDGYTANRPGALWATVSFPISFPVTNSTARKAGRSGRI